jgi:predicted dehydrogenase
MADQVGIAIIGCGYWGINYVRVFSELADSRVVVVCDQQVERLQEIGRRFSGVQLISDVEEALQVDGVDCVVVCTPAKTHASISRRCLLAGKHVLVEKPIATTAFEAEGLHVLAGEQNLVLMVGHTFLYNPAVRKVKDYLTHDEAGRIYYLYASRTNLGPIRHDVNALWDLAPHDVSIFNYLLGSTPRWVSAVGAKVLRNSREDVGFITLGYQDDVVGHIHVSWADPNKVREVVVVGSDKRIVFNDLNTLEPVRLFDKGVTPVVPEPASYGEYRFLMREGDITSPRIEVSEPLKNECSHYLECVTQNNCAPFTDALQGLEVVRVMEAVDHSMRLNGTPVELSGLEASRKLDPVSEEGEVVNVSIELHEASLRLA